MESQERIDWFLENLSDADKTTYQKALEGDPKSQVEMDVLAEDWGLCEYAEYWARKAAEQGYVSGYIELGVMLDTWLDRIDEAAEWYMKAAEADNREGYTFLFSAVQDVSLSPELKVKSINFLISKAKEGHQLAAALVNSLKEVLGKNFDLKPEYYKQILLSAKK